MGDKRTLVINLYGGAGCGKTTLMAGLFYILKTQGYDCEMAPEYVKGLLWDGTIDASKDQLYLLGNQSHMIERMIGKVEFVITDSPVMLCKIYNDYYGRPTSEGFSSIVLDTMKKYDRLNFFINRGETYMENGRNETLEQSKEIDEMILKYLNDNDEKYYFIEQKNALNDIIGIMKQLKLID